MRFLSSTPAFRLHSRAIAILSAFDRHFISQSSVPHPLHRPAPVPPESRPARIIRPAGRSKVMYKSIASLAVIASAFAVPAQAQDLGVKTAVIRHADIDFSSRADRARFDRRIAIATETVCGSYAGASADEAVAIKRCRTAAYRQVTAQLGARTDLAMR
jgi:UrcA family protein